MGWNILSKLSLSFLSILLFGSLSATAEITITEVTGTSSRTFSSTGVEVIAGFNGTCATTSTGVCDSCTSPASTSTCTVGDANCCGGTTCFTCNTRTVTDSTVLTITLKSDNITSGTVKIKSTTDSRDSTTTSNSGGVFTFTRPWSDICQLVASCSCSDISSGSCTELASGTKSADLTLEVTGTDTETDSGTVKFSLYFQSSTNSGTASSPAEESLRDFFVYPGDEKVYIEQSNIGNFTNLSGIQFYIGTGSFEYAYVKAPQSPTAAGETLESAFQDVDTDGTIAQVIDGLENGVTYHFRPASVDKAGNVYNAMDDAYLIGKSCGVTTSGGGNADCSYAGTPSKVVGLLTEDLNCFVATAAYGSQLDPHIDTFRSFRQKVLLRSQLGMALNRAYYNYGPKMARALHEHPWMKPLARAILWPAWGLTFLSLHFHFNPLN